MKACQLSLIVPCYNEGNIIAYTNKELLGLLYNLIHKGMISESSYILYVDDGSDDNQWDLIKKLSLEDKRVHAIKLARNYGHQNALLAGLLNSNCDMAISIDADLQDDISAVEKMVELYNQGYDIVYGVRKSRKTDSFFKRNTAKLYYKLLKLMGVNVIYDHADFRLMSKKALDALKNYTEVNLFLRGIIKDIGLKSAVVYYDRLDRISGISKYTCLKMFKLALDGITSFSVFPLRCISLIGIILFFISFVLGSWVLWVYFVKGNAVPGWASSVLPIYLLGGIQLLSLGIVGEYIAKIYNEVKKRPRFFIEKSI